MSFIPGTLYDGGVTNLPANVTLHPLDGNVVSQVPIYDYSQRPPRIVGYRITSYAYDDRDVDGIGILLNLGLPIPNREQPVSFTNGNITYAYVVKPVITGMIEQLAPLGIAAVCTPCGGVELALKIGAGVETVNSMITSDAHLRTHDIYFSEPPLLTPLDQFP